MIEVLKNLRRFPIDRWIFSLKRKITAMFLIVHPGQFFGWLEQYFIWVKGGECRPQIPWGCRVCFLSLEETSMFNDNMPTVQQQQCKHHIQQVVRGLRERERNTKWLDWYNEIKPFQSTVVRALIFFRAPCKNTQNLLSMHTLQRIASRNRLGISIVKIYSHNVVSIPRSCTTRVDQRKMVPI